MRPRFPEHAAGALRDWIVLFFRLWCRNQWKRERYAPSFHLDDEHVRPVWPSRPGEQQIQIHLDIATDDLDAAVAHAFECGAEPADHQPQDDVRVMLDPDGHPFCLFHHEW